MDIGSIAAGVTGAGVAGGTVLAFLRLRTEKEGTAATAAGAAAQGVAEAAAVLINPLHREITATRERIIILEEAIRTEVSLQKECRGLVEGLREEIKALQAQLGGRRTNDD